MLSDDVPAPVNKTNPTDENIQVQAHGGNNQASGKKTLEKSVRSAMAEEKKGDVHHRTTGETDH
jgi:hypothetical protein